MPNRNPIAEREELPVSGFQLPVTGFNKTIQRKLCVISTSRFLLLKGRHFKLSQGIYQSPNVPTERSLRPNIIYYLRNVPKRRLVGSRKCDIQFIRSVGMF